MTKTWEERERERETSATVVIDDRIERGVLNDGEIRLQVKITVADVFKKFLFFRKK
jgi:hypothetical protein